jgi:hypothetical protein
MVVLWPFYISMASKSNNPNFWIGRTSQMGDGGSYIRFVENLLEVAHILRRVLFVSMTPEALTSEVRHSLVGYGFGQGTFARVGHHNADIVCHDHPGILPHEG